MSFWRCKFRFKFRCSYGGVPLCRVDVAVAALQGGHHRVVRFVTIGNAIHPESELWHLHAIIQRQICLPTCARS